MRNKTIDNIPKGFVAPSSIHGLGLFANSDLKRLETISILDGQIVNWELIKEFCENSEWNALNEQQVLYRPFKTKYFFINHSRTPNLEIITVKPRTLEIQVLKDLKFGEELLLDYRKEPLPEWYVNGHGATYL